MKLSTRCEILQDWPLFLNGFLHQLGRDEIAAVVAIDCLDEGVDVPQVHQAILLASSASERQFIQRRGRILRKAPGKTFAYLGCQENTVSSRSQ